MAGVSVRDVRKSFGETVVIHGVTIDVADGEFVVIVGPSGCGKSTLLRMVAGLERITLGRDRDRRARRQRARAEGPRHRDGVPELRALSAHERVRQHGLRPQDPRHRRRPRSASGCKRAADILELGALLERKPRQLSGGQRQRVAMGRAIVREPAVFLFDEPLSNLDAKLRVQMRFEIQKLHRRLGTTSLYVTHDQVEAMTLAQRMIVMNAGRAEQIGAPMDVYENPATQFVAGFIGSPAMNFLPGKVDGTIRIALDGGGAARGSRPSPAAGRAVTVGIRPEHLVPCAAADGIPWRRRRNGRAARRRFAGARRARRRARSSPGCRTASLPPSARRCISAADPARVPLRRRDRRADQLIMSESLFHDWPYPRLVAHRGAGTLAPENTLTAMRVGHAHGYRMVEFDVKLAADNLSFLLHDDTLERTTSGRGRADAFPWRELSRLDAGGWHSAKYAGEPLPTLAAIARWARAHGVACNVEIKPTPGRERETGAAVALDVNSLWRDAEVMPLLSSFSEESLAAARDAVPLLPRALLLDELPADWQGGSSVSGASRSMPATKSSPPPSCAPRTKTATACCASRPTIRCAWRSSRPGVSTRSSPMPSTGSAPTRCRRRRRCTADLRAGIADRTA